MCIHFNDWAFKIQDSRIILMLFAFVDKWDGMLVIHLEVSHIAPPKTHFELVSIILIFISNLDRTKIS